MEYTMDEKMVSIRSGVVRTVKDYVLILMPKLREVFTGGYM